MLVWTFERLRIMRDIFGQEFQGYEAVQLYIFSLVDDTHPAAAQLFDDAVVRDSLVDHEWRKDSGWNVRDEAKPKSNATG